MFNWISQRLEELPRTLLGVVGGKSCFESLSPPAGGWRGEYSGDLHLNSQFHWSSAQLQSYIESAAREKTYTITPPGSIDFSAYAPLFDRLLTLASDGRERARVGYVNLVNGKVVFKGTHVGDRESVSLFESYHVYERPVIFVHNHPVESSPEANYHFSHKDFKSLLGSPTEQFMVMVTEGLTLIGMKTANTPPRSKSVDERIDQIRERCMRTELFSLRHLLLWRFTQEVCKEMHIALYKIEHSDNDGIARQVELTRNPSLASGLSTLLRWLSK